MRKIEILAPAGAEEQLRAAVRTGADAVYLGAKHFNARRNAENFDGRSMRDTVAYCHARDVNVYVTVNTLILDSEMPLLEQEADALADAGVDAVIIQDMAVLRLFANRYPSIARYASTQTAVHNADGAKRLADMGFDSIVLARELTLSEMERVCRAVDVKIEAFIHGAHCMSLSGACYLSAMLGGRSGNRGLCAQPCRLDWRCGKRAYALSLKDMSLIPHIREMADAGVDSFKIEGRMKRPEYVAAAVTCCRAALEGKAYDIESLRAVFSRSGFTDGYLTGKRDKEMFGYRTKEDVASAEPVLRQLAALYRAEKPRVPVDLHFELTDAGSRLTASDGAHSVTAEGDAPERAVHRATDAESAQKSLEKTGGTPFFVRSLSCDIGEGLVLPASSVNALRRDALDALLLLRQACRPHERREYAIEGPERRTPREAPALWARFVSEERIVEAETFEKILLPIERITPETVARLGDRLVAQLPTMLFPDDAPALAKRLDALCQGGLTAVWTNNIYALALGQRLGLTVHGGFGLNVTNTEAIREYERQGLSSLTVSFELAMGKIKALGGRLPLGIAAYGYLPLMHFRNCPVRAAIGCAACDACGTLTDRRGTAFPVECADKKGAVLLNSVPLHIADRDLGGLDYALLYFTTESEAETRRVLEDFRLARRTEQPHTGGLYYRELL